jgi:hypothetical protein
MVIGNVPHTVGTTPNLIPYTITNVPGAGKSQLFGAFYANIAKTTTNANRSTLDKDRMILLQQLVAAKLNCTIFICIPSVISMISTADAAYASGNTAAILNSANLLDAYNTSNDSASLGLYNPGSATPSTSSSNANKVFWNQP